MAEPAHITLTEAQWEKVLDDTDGYTVDDISDVRLVLTVAQEAIGGTSGPLACPELSHIHLTNTADMDAEDFDLHVDIGPLRLTRSALELKPFQEANTFSGAVAAQHVLQKLLDYRNSIRDDLDAYVQSRGGS